METLKKERFAALKRQKEAAALIRKKGELSHARAKFWSAPECLAMCKWKFCHKGPDGKQLTRKALRLRSVVVVYVDYYGVCPDMIKIDRKSFKASVCCCLCLVLWFLS